MFEVLLTVLVLVVLLGLWHAVLARFGRVPAWARTTVRLALPLAVAAEATLYVWMQSRSRSVPIDQINHVWHEILQWSGAAHVTSASLLLAAAAALGVVTARRGLARGKAATGDRERREGSAPPRAG